MNNRNKKKGKRTAMKMKKAYFHDRRPTIASKGRTRIGHTGHH